NAPGVSNALNMGSNLYLTSYSRDQEREADSLGLRYMTRGGYDATAMPAFLSSMQAETALESGKGEQFSYFSTHPATSERVVETRAESLKYPKGGDIGEDRYFSMLDGLVYGDNVAQGFARGRNFYHPGLGLSFSVPEGFKIVNQPNKV